MHSSPRTHGILLHDQCSIYIPLVAKVIQVLLVVITVINSTQLHLLIVPALGNWGGADTRLPPPTADFGDVPGVVAFLRNLPFSVINEP